jgi:cytochrome c peroxidase
MRIATTIVTVGVLATCFLALERAELTQAQGVGARPDLDATKRDYRRPAPRRADNQALVDLGRDLFFDPRISASGKTACASCHFPELGYVVTDAHPRNDSGKPSARKSQPLIGLGYAGNAPVGWDGRNPNLEAQAKNSIATGSMSMRETETPVKVEAIEERVRSAPDYGAKFTAALPGKAIDIDTIAQAVAAFERTLEPGVAPFDRWIAGDEAAVHRQGRVLCLPQQLEIYRRPVPRYRHHHDRSRPRPRGQGRHVEFRVQDPDAALGGAARALHAQRVARHACRRGAAL